MRKPHSATRAYLISFSGIDGSGKSTQITAVLGWLARAGLRVRVIRFWDDVATLGWLREGASHTILKSERGIGAPGRPVQRRDKNVRAWYMTAARVFLYGLDALHLSYVAARSRKNVDVVIFDRYLYDQLANLELENPIVRSYAKLLLKIAPKPDSPFVLDADSVQARARKPEYPLEFLYQNRAAYLVISSFAEKMIVIAPAPAEEVTRNVLRELETAIAQHSANLTDSRALTDVTADNLPVTEAEVINKH